MRRGTVATLGMILCLVLGIFMGLVFPRGALPWDNSWVKKVSTTMAPATITPVPPPSAPKVEAETQTEEGLNPRDSLDLMESASEVVLCLKERDYKELAKWVDDQRGVTFTPYSAVDVDYDLTFTKKQIAEAEESTTVYNWGLTDGSGLPIQLTMTDYFDQFVYNADYAQATQIAVDKVLISGNSLENVADAYGGCRFVDFSFPSRDPELSGLDWCSLKLVFAPNESEWSLVGIIHGQWTV